MTMDRNDIKRFSNALHGAAIEVAISTSTTYYDNESRIVPYYSYKPAPPTPKELAQKRAINILGTKKGRWK